MRIATLAVTGMLAAFLAFPAAAATKTTNLQASTPPTWEQCYEQASKHQLHRSQKGHDEYMSQCLAGKTSLRARAAVQIAGTFEQCEQRASGVGLPHGQTGHTEYVRECMGRRPGSRRNF